MGPISKRPDEHPVVEPTDTKDSIKYPAIGLGEATQLDMKHAESERGLVRWP